MFLKSNCISICPSFAQYFLALTEKGGPKTRYFISVMGENETLMLM